MCSGRLEAAGQGDDLSTQDIVDSQRGFLRCWQREADPGDGIGGIGAGVNLNLLNLIYNYRLTILITTDVLMKYNRTTFYFVECNVNYSWPGVPVLSQW